ncbi:MAG TPA: hypothetical protein VFC24_18840 [Casimicrobiaceae bacterium]|nr:hypothetical protein [Casimicrobiaceae bacterium]
MTSRSSQARRLRLAAVSALFLAQAALSGPVLVYREGAACPHDRPATAPRLTPEQAKARAKALLPRDFCGPTYFVSGCDFEPEMAFDSWRVFARQYKEVDGVKRYGGLDHSYVVLDLVGNCIANIPGT